jgi:hypothetical protein
MPKAAMEEKENPSYLWIRAITCWAIFCLLLTNIHQMEATSSTSVPNGRVRSVLTLSPREQGWLKIGKSTSVTSITTFFPPSLHPSNQNNLWLEAYQQLWNMNFTYGLVDYFGWTKREGLCVLISWILCEVQSINQLLFGVHKIICWLICN